MKTTLKLIGSSALMSMLLTLPFITMEVVNRRKYAEDFPFMLFFALWFNLFAISFILLPILRGRRTGNDDQANPMPVQRNSRLSNPNTAALISVALLLILFIIYILGTLGWEPLERLVNGPNPEVFYIPGFFINLAIFALPVAAGIIARVPIVRTHRAGGSLFAHPVNLIIIILLVSAITFGVVELIIDQWPCFMGVPTCD